VTQEAHAGHVDAIGPSVCVILSLRGDQADLRERPNQRHADHRQNNFRSPPHRWYPVSSFDTAEPQFCLEPPPLSRGRSYSTTSPSQAMPQRRLYFARLLDHRRLRSGLATGCPSALLFGWCAVV
jgi:hypothetical protein